jgi:hypothetical protein
MRLIHCRNLVQRAACQPAAEHGVERGNAEWLHSGIFQAGRPLHAGDRVTQLLHVEAWQHR